jgi:hypothetical protein
MFETDDFKKQLTDAISSEAGANNMQQYQLSVVDYLQNLAIVNERSLMVDEMRKSAGARRGVLEALGSARELTREASKYAALDRRTVLQESDIQAAYRAKFCQVWPFCKS